MDETWHGQVRLPGRDYYPIGDGVLLAHVQADTSGTAPAVTLLLERAGKFGWDVRGKRDNPLFHPASGLTDTALRVSVDGVEFTALPGNTTVAWAESGVPVVTATWWAGPVRARESFVAGDGVLHRGITLDNRAETDVTVQVELRLRPNPDRCGTPEATGRTSACCRYGTGVLAVGLLPVGTGDLTGTERIGPDVVAVRDDLRRLAAGGTVVIESAYLLAEDATAAPRRLADALCHGPDAIAAARGSRSAAAVLSCSDGDLVRLLDSAVRGLAPTARKGRVNAGLWQYAGEWVRDSSMVALGMLHAGLPEQATRVLDRVLDALVDDDGRTAVHDAVPDEDGEQFDQAGELLHALAGHLAWTGDDTVAIRHWARITALADRLVRRRDASGLLRGVREFWERDDLYGIPDGYELAYQCLAALGLRAAGDLATMLGRRPDPRWAGAAGELGTLVRTRFVHDGVLAKRIDLAGRPVDVVRPLRALPPRAPLGCERVARLNPCTSTVLPFVHGLLDAADPLAARTVAALDPLWNARWDGGGYDRYHTSSEPDSPGPWTFGTWFVARAALRCGDHGRAMRAVRWLARSAPGAVSGYWHEYAPIIPPAVPCGLIPWTSAEAACFVVADVLGVTPTAAGIRLRPRDTGTALSARAEIPVRGERLVLHRDGERTLVRFGGREFAVPIGGDLTVPWG